jgi:integrase
MGLGSVDLVSLAEARDKRDCHRKLLKQGIDPIEHRKAQLVQDAANAVTFQECGDDYIKIHREEWHPKHAAEWERSLSNYAYPEIGHRPARFINLEDVLKVLDPIWTRIPTTADRLRGRVQIILDYAWACGYRDKRDDNPADWEGPLHLRLADLSKKRKPKHFAAVPFERLPEFMAALRQEEGVPARALEFLILTSARTEEIIGAKWDHIHGLLWIIPAELMKVDERADDPRLQVDEDCTRPLSDAARAVLNQMAEIRSGDYLFPGSDGGHLPVHALRRVLSRVLRRIGHAHAVPHGFRSTFYT